MNNEREAFEAYQNSIGASTSKNNDGKYFSETANAAWMGWQAALANKPEAVPMACYTKTYGVQMLKAGFLADLPNNTLLYTAPPSTAALQKRMEELQAVISKKDDIFREILSANTKLQAENLATDALALKAGDVQAPKECTNSDTWNCKYCNKTKTCEALKDPRNFGEPIAAAPKLNEEVASGEAVCSICNNSGYYCIGYSGLECDGNAPMLERCDCEIGQPTPSPSNVLVEALRKISECLSLRGGDRYLDTVISGALATYSASTDSVSVSRSEYEAMKADVERMNYICDDKNIYWIHIQTEPSGLDLFHSGRAPELREAIDTARKSSW